MAKCSDLLDVAVDSVVLGFDLFRDPASLTRMNLRRALRAKKVQAEMNKAFSAEAVKLMASPDPTLLNGVKGPN